MRVVDVGVLGKLGGVNDAWQSEIEKAAIRYETGEGGGRGRKLRGGGARHREATP